MSTRLQDVSEKLHIQLGALLITLLSYTAFELASTHFIGLGISYPEMLI